MHRDRGAGLHEANFLCGMGQQHRLERERGICSSYAQAAARVPWVRVSAPALCVALPSPPALALALALSAGVGLSNGHGAPQG